MNMKHLLLIFGVFLLLLTSCQKENDDPNNTKKDLLTSAAWKLVSFKVTVGTVTEEVFDTFEPCSTDDLITFRADNTVLLDEGLTKCEPDDPQNTTGTWSFSENETKLTINGEIATILALTGTELKLSSTVTVEDVTEIRVVTFGH